MQFIKTFVHNKNYRHTNLNQAHTISLKVLAVLGSVSFLKLLVLNSSWGRKGYVNMKHGNIRGLKIWVRVRDRVQERLFNSSFQGSRYHNTSPSYPMSYPLCLKPTRRARALETLPIWKSKIALELNLVIVVQSKYLYCYLQRVQQGIDLENARELLLLAAFA